MQAFYLKILKGKIKRNFVFESDEIDCLKKFKIKLDVYLINTYILKM